MAVLKIVEYGEDVLRQRAKEVHKVSAKVKQLVRDLLDTMYANDGVGLAAPQIGVSQRVFVIDTSSGDEPLNPLVFINPKLFKKEGAISSYEGCLSFPDAYTNVRRYENVSIKALDKNGKSFVVEAKGGSLLARAIQHEFDHLNGVLFVDHARNRFETDQELQQKGLKPIEVENLIDEPELEEEIAKKEQAKEQVQESKEG